MISLLPLTTQLQLRRGQQFRSNQASFDLTLGLCCELWSKLRDDMITLLRKRFLDMGKNVILEAGGQCIALNAKNYKHSHLEWQKHIIKGKPVS